MLFTLPTTRLVLSSWLLPQNKEPWICRDSLYGAHSPDAHIVGSLANFEDEATLSERRAGV